MLAPRGKRFTQGSRKDTKGRRGGAGFATMIVGPEHGLPLVNHILDRMGLEDLLEEHLPPDNPRTELPTNMAHIHASSDAHEGRNDSSIRTQDCRHDLASSAYNAHDFRRCIFGVRRHGRSRSREFRRRRKCLLTNDL